MSAVRLIQVPYHLGRKDEAIEDPTRDEERRIPRIAARVAPRLVRAEVRS